ncbi:FAD-dependent monooxygenase [Catenovulum sp. SM1970]|uniref:FAD-dependent oxidoreductase n=1 Tax=Marinifaba aquimaris TaxID=2741323 RepID=UPI0015724FA2|nr:FAD-dependent monooxygenase [Marinifaba aquimaris]NTS75308.1 FAD-dependent monooxygenase [Marinifaba aquimaris]
MEQPIEILIIGAGTTGLTLANDLARRGVPFKIIDAKSGPTKDSKGLALNISSQHGLNLIGVEQKIGASSKHIQRLNIHWENKRYSSINFNQLDGDIRYLMTQPQSVTEEELLQSLSAQGHQVHWAHKLDEIKENKDNVYVTISKGEQVLEESFRYVVGCDGKHSKVREHLNCNFDGFDYDMYFVLGDFTLDLNIKDTEVQYYVYPDTFFIIVPIGENKWRIVAKYDGEVPTEPPSEQEIESIIARHFGKAFSLGKAKWISRAPFYSRVADKIVSKRTFIAGDAAHLFSPIGGTGMNTGLQDAFNLGWKLSAVYHKLSEESLLKSYEHERLPAIKAAAQVSELSTELITRKLTEHPIISQLSPKLENRAYLRDISPRAHSGMAQKLPLPNDDTVEQNNLGCYCPVITYLAHNKRLFSDKFDAPTLWCLVPITWLNRSKTELNKLRDKIFQYPKAQVIYFQFNEAVNESYAIETQRECIAQLPQSIIKQAASNETITVVRPDGMIMYESNNHELYGLEQAINNNLKPLQTIQSVS